MKEKFIPVALKAAQVGNPPDSPEGRLYREIGRSKPAPQGICAVNSAGKVLAWSLMFDDDKSVLAFLDYAAARFAEFPDATNPVPAVRFQRFPSQKLNEIEDTRAELEVPGRHPGPERCIATTGVPAGTVLARAYGRALKEGRPVEETLRQDQYVEDRFEVFPSAQEALARAAAEAGAERFKMPAELARALVGHAYLGMLDVNPLGAPGGKNDRQKLELWCRKEGNLLRIEGTSDVAGGHAAAGFGSDGRLWTHEVSLAWKGRIELKDRRIARLLVLAEGRERLKWGNERMHRAGQSEVSMLPGGRPIDFAGDVRYGMIGEPARPEQVGGPDGSLPEKMQRLQDLVQARRQEGRDLSKLGEVLEEFQRLAQQGKTSQAGAVLDRAIELLEGDAEKGAAPAPRELPGAIRAKIEKFHEALQEFQKSQQAVQEEIQKIPPLLEKGDYEALDRQLDKVLELLKRR